jgi:hypothetical protein
MDRFMNEEMNWEEYEKILLQKPGFKEALNETIYEYEFARTKVIENIRSNMIKKDIHMAYILYKYVGKAMSEAVYEKIGKDKYAGKIPSCWGVIAFAPTLEECKCELLSVLEDWILVGLRFGDPLPIVGGIDPNCEISDEERILRRAKEAEKSYRDGDVKIGSFEDFWKDMND